MSTINVMQRKGANGLSDVLGILAECRECGSRFGVSPESGTTHFRQEYVSEDGRSILLTYYDCPKCGKRHFAQIDTVHSLAILSDVTKSFAQLAAARRKGRKVVPATWRKRYEKQKGHLDRCRKRLMREWTGKRVLEVGTGVEYVLEFSV